MMTGWWETPNSIRNSTVCLRWWWFDEWKFWTCIETGAITCRLHKTYLRKEDQKYLERFAMWCWRIVTKKISWTDRVRNEELHRVKEERNFLHAMKRMKSSRIGHILRRNRLLKHVLEGKNKRRKGEEEDVSSYLWPLKNRYWHVKKGSIWSKAIGTSTSQRLLTWRRTECAVTTAEYRWQLHTRYTVSDK